MCWKSARSFGIIRRCMKTAVIKLAGSQFRVSEGDIIEVNKIPGKKDQEISIDNVLLSHIDNEVKIGAPYIPGFSVVGKIIEQKKGEKIYVSKFKAKSRFRKRIGFRAQLTKLAIVQIGSKTEKEESKGVKTAPKKTRVKKT